MEPSLVKSVLEAALLAAREPLTPSDMKKMFDDELSTDTVRKLLDQLREEWAERPVELSSWLPAGVFEPGPSTCLISSA